VNGPRLAGVKALAVVVLCCLATSSSAAQLDEARRLDATIRELSAAQRFGEAIPLAERALAIRTSLLGPDHLDVATSLDTLAELWVAQRRPDEAERLYRRALAIRREVLGPDHPDVAGTLRNLARCCHDDEIRMKRAGEAHRAAEAARAAAAARAEAARAAEKQRREAILRGSPPALPEFPWPPPAASAVYVLPPKLFAARPTVGDVVDAIISALERTGYVERSFFRTQKDGVALVTRLERINGDGSALPENERWPSALRDRHISDLVGFLRGLFYADSGHYRVIVFVLHDLPFVQSRDEPTASQARAWLREGANVLPREVRSRPLGEGTCSALIYQFASDGTAVRLVQSSLTGRQHLEKTGVLPSLESQPTPSR
jgi:hypothetical protein